MWKPLVVLAIVANSPLITPSEGTKPGPYPDDIGHGNPHRKCHKPNEIYDLCPNPCPPRECGVDETLILCPLPPKPGSSACKPGCICADGFLRNSAGICIPEDDCEYDCGRNETLDSCLSDCPPRYCGVNIAAVSCLAIDEDDCEPGCRCSDGYLENAEGDCVLEKDCPQCSKPNEVYDVCPALCPGYICGVDETLIDCKPPPKPGDSECQPGCRCADGFLRNPEGICVTKDQCPQCTGPNEVYDVCPNPCPPQRCDVDPRVIRCPKPPEPGSSNCEPGCRCIDGYVRNEKNICVTRDQCVSCGGDFNAEPGCDENCTHRCPGPKPKECKCYKDGCKCKEGFVYDPQIQKCVRLEECLSPCGDNEVLSNCSNGGCGPWRCTDVGFPTGCVKMDLKFCTVDCVCEEGYVRDENEVCIPVTDCPECGGDPNAIAGCGINCGRLCSNYKKKDVACIAECRRNACDCRKGFVLDENTNRCVLPKDCSPVCGKNEVFSECVNGGCDAKYSQCTGPNEVYDVCPNPCPPQRCDVDARVIRCPKPPEPGSSNCEPGCRCIDGYVRNEKNICVTRDQCVSCGGDFNAEPGCDENCTHRCPGPKPKECKCYKDCCKCKEGFVYDPQIQKCVRLEECPQCTGPNEVYDVCPNPCPPQRCDVDPRVIRCPKPPEPGSSNCEPGCRCIDGYVRNEKNICVTRDQCVSCGGDFNAEPGCDESCTHRCPGPKPKECKCHKDCCKCKEGFVYDPQIQKCVRLEECLSLCGDNEVLSNCSNGGCGPWRCTDVGIPTGCVKMDQKYCIVDCVCKEGYVRNENEVCIPVTDCPECGGDPNAIAGCGINCGRLCSNYKKKDVTCIAECRRNACDCRKGFVLDENTNRCVLPKDCSPVCGKNEVFSECVNGGCDAKNCSQLGKPVPCVKPAVCKKGCLCADGYLRDANGVCIPKDQCPQKCTGAYEIYDPCPPSCPPQTCESIGKKFFCPFMSANKTQNCHGACRCKPNYFRNKIGDCISEKDCLKCTGPNEFFSCGGACDNVCATLNEQNQTNCPIINIKCNEMCYCEEGYARNASNICIPIEDCPRKCCENERWDECPAKLCSPQSCKDLGFDVSCQTDENSPCPGPPGCVCDYNFVRDENGKCIPKEECPSCGGDPNAKAGCGLNCGRLCSNYNKGPVPCPRICFPNACDCKKGFVFDENTKKCVRPKECTPICKEHEVYSECTNGGCDARNCSQLGKPVPCVKLDPKSCIKGCVCEEGYLRARNCTCVPEDQCDNCNQPHEHYDCCAPSCPPQTCESIGRQYKCPARPTVCKGACRCDEGYFRNKIGECIRKIDCLKCKGPHEYFSCGGACDNVCATLYKQNQTNCPIINIKCNEMCYCEEGYARNENNVCIPIDKCPKPRCGVNERLEQCPPALCTPQKCTELGFPVACPDFTNSCPEPPGCVCLDGHVRNCKGLCIPAQRCPSCGGDPNAVAGCGVNCGRTCATYKKKNVFCPEICDINGCDCRKGFVYDDNIRKCVRPCDCTPTCGENEVYTSCANGGCGKWNCTQLGQPDLCIDPLECEGGCICAEGYLRAKNGTCVPINQCPVPKCEKNERFVFCPDTLCEPQTCSELGFPVPCPVTTSDSACPGEPACICDNGFVRNDNGVCIPKKQCPSCGGDPNAESGCGLNCGRLCSNYNKGPVPCPKICKVNSCDCKKDFVFDTNTKKCVRPKECTPICGNDEVYSECINGGCQPKNCSQIGKPVPCIKMDPKYCIKGCLCKEGYLRDSNGVCIPKEKCIQYCFGSNEVYEPCPPICPPQTCESIGKTFHCPLVKTDKANCKPACRCKEGFYRNKIGQCISEADCQKCTGPHEYFSCGGACDNVCETLDKQNQTNCPIINVKCNEMCYCEKEYARDKNNICIPIDQCLPPTCGENERLEDCPDRLCSPQSCSEVGFPVNCPALNGDSSSDSPCPGRPGCVCVDNYVRDDNGKCIPIKECPSCGGDPNAVSGCGVNCGRLCSNYKKKGVVCPLFCKLNGCDCKDGFVFDSNTKKCVLPKDCTPICGINEMYDICANGGCQKRNCTQVGQLMLCIDPVECIPGCVCQEGFLRNSDGDCVPEDQCPQNCFGSNEVYEPCPPFCSPQTCESIGKKFYCALVKTDEANCKPACRCKKGFYRNKIGQCISEADCQKCTGPHEYFSCGGACDNVCETLDKQNQTNCPIINVKCNEMCYCEKEYARDKNNICIPIDQCPPPTCGSYERLEDCPDRLCSPQSCSEVGFPVDCPALNGDSSSDSPCPGRPGCVCVDNYVRDENGRCISIKECPSCGGDPNAVSGCGVNCGRLCSNYKKKGVLCPFICKVNGCDCKDGFVFDSNTGKCVLPKDCTPPCGVNEMYDICANGGCQKRNCTQVGQPMLCIDPVECIPGCVCQEGFLRNSDGDCVPEDQCPPLQCTKPHEVYDPCPRTCPPQICEAIGLAYPCPNPPEGEEFCNPACRCEDGYYRNSIDECISESDCLKCTGPNEYFSCGPACDNECATLSTQNQTNCPIKNKKCNNKCYCNQGYARDDNNICIPIEQCGVSCNGDPNAISGCGGYCGRRCSDYNKGPVACPLSCRLGACDCKQGYVYDDILQKCVLPEDCTTCNRPHEVFNSCPSTCPPQTCESLERAYICPIETGNEPPCEPGCVCEDGYFRNKIGECLTQEECKRCTGPHEYYSCGGACDNVCETLNEQNQTNCPIINIKCNEMCYCEEGYARNATNICIPIEDCPPPRCGPDERYEESPCRVCEPLTCCEVGVPMDCPPVEDDDCEDTPACICKYGLVRNDDDVCIPISECPSENSVNVTEARARLDEGSIAFSGKFLYYLASTKPDENIVASPTSVMIPLAQLLAYAINDVLQELLALLNLKNKEEVKAVFPVVTDEYEHQEKVEFEVTSKTYINKNYPLTENFIEDSKRFKSEAENIDFGQNVEAAKIINDWVSESTRGKIQDLVNADMFSDDTRLCLVNAIYFLGNWVHQFNPNNTEVKDFYKSNGETVPKKIMYQQNKFNYAENDQYQVLKMPYKNENFSFVVVLPREKDGLLPVLKSIEEPDAFNEMIKSLIPRNVKVYLPKMLIETGIDLKEVLQKNNAGKMFDPSNNGFEGILKHPEPIYISDAVQKAFISVNELGTEAAAATAVIVGLTSAMYPPPKTYEFIATRSFAFYLLYGSLESSYKTPLFCGTYVGAE